MNLSTKTSITILFLTGTILVFNSCKKEDSKKDSLVIETSAVTNITATTALTGGNITSEGASTIIIRGVCWSTNPTPTIDLYTKNRDGFGAGDFISNICGLNEGTTYYIRAYATTNEGTTYGNEVSFTTISGGSSSTVTDIDCNVYNTVTIGTQVWMVENLKTTRYSDGTEIGYVNDAAIWSTLTETNKAYCWINDDIGNKEMYGALYTWAAAMKGEVSSNLNPSGVQGACPTGWHIPSNLEFIILTEYLTDNGFGYEGSGSDVAKSMAATSGWNTNVFAGNVGNDQASNNSSGFTAVPSGYRGRTNGNFNSIGGYGTWWTSTEFSPTLVVNFGLASDNSNIQTYENYWSVGFSVRCVKD